MPWTTQSTRTAKKKRSEAYAVYSKKSELLIEQFMIDRKKAKIVFLSDEMAQSKLELNRPFQKNRLKQFDMSKTFFTVLSDNPVLLEPLANISRNAFKEEPQMMEAFGFIVKN